MSLQYPFSAIVGQDDLKTALLLNAIDARIGGLLVLGQRGTAKSTAARALAALLPPIQVYSGSRFGCGPGDEAFDVCDASAPLVELPTPFVDLPIGTSEDRVTGTLDLERTLRSGERHFEPGLLAAAHRGVLYIDEVNLLPDHLVDLLLDVAASGLHSVEREGVSVRHPARFLLVGTMNPEEGDLRPQFVDRFGLSVTVTAPQDAAERMDVVRRRVAFDSNPEDFVRGWCEAEGSLTARVRGARERVASVEMSEALLALTVRVCVEATVDGLRADLTIYRAARALAALEERPRVVEDDIYRAALLALPHRRRPHPLGPPPSGGAPRSLEEIIAEHRADSERGDEPRNAAESDGVASASDRKGGASPPQVPDRTESSTDDLSSPDRGTAAPDRLVSASAPIPLRLPEPPRGRPGATRTDRRSAAGPADGRGRVIGTGTWDHRSSDIAPLASTLAAALAPAQPETVAGAHATPRLVMLPRHLRQRRRRASAQRFVLFVVDCSGSMGARDRMAITKGAILALLADAYRGRNLVALMTFRHAGASLLIKPTRDVVRAMDRLQTLPTGGRTPLGAALLEAAALVRRERARTNAAETRVVLITDGRTDQMDVSRGILALTAECDDIVVIDSEHGFVRLGRARALASLLGAQYVRLVA
ncbi:MAG: VWA domain-containing protein [Chloroflexi bacterium]|nr:VWA domain-containing protein [Chloroflexota bacterium]